MKRFPVDRTLKKIFDETEEHFEGRVDREQIKEIFYFFWANCKSLMATGMFITINMPKWGRLVPYVTKIKAWSMILPEGDKKERLIADIERLNIEKQKRKRK